MRARACKIPLNLCGVHMMTLSLNPQVSRNSTTRAVSFHSPFASVLRSNDERGIKCTRLRHQQVRRRGGVGRCRMTPLAKSPCEVHDCNEAAVASAAARMSRALFPPLAWMDHGWMPLKSTVLNPFTTGEGRRGATERLTLATDGLRSSQNPSTAATLSSSGRRVALSYMGG